MIGFCADVGGSFIKFAEVDATGVIGQPQLCPTPARSWTEFRAALRRLCGNTPAAAPLSLSIAGVVDPETELAFSANVPCINGHALAPELGRDLGRPVRVANDADCMALAEAQRGAGLGHHVVFGAVLGSGVGGGLVFDGRIVRGAGGIAGEWGHGPILGTFDAGGCMIPPQPCGCGQTGCLDTLGGAHGLERLHRLLHHLDGASRDICRMWQAGDAHATRTIQVWLEVVAGPLAVVINTTGAGIVPVAGGLGNNARLIDALDTAVRRRILRRTDAPVVVPSRFGDEAGLVGAALLLGEKGRGAAPPEEVPGNRDTERP